MAEKTPYLESKSHPYLARIAAKWLQGDSCVPVVRDSAGLWRFDGLVWRKLHEDAAFNAVMKLEHMPVASGYDEDKQTVITKPMSLTYGTILGIRNVLYTLKEVYHPEFFEEASKGIQFTNGFLSLEDNGEISFEASSPKHRQRVFINWDWDPNAKAPRFEQALDQWFEPKSIGEEEFDVDQDAKEKVQFLQEFMGACLTGVAPKFGKAAVLFGKGSNGKSAFIDAVMKVFPKDYTSSIEPQHMGQEYRAAQLEGKHINFAADIPSHEIVSSSMLKAVITGDIVTARHIRKDPFQFRPRAGHVFSANELPGTRDQSKGFWRRFVVIPFNNQFNEKNKDIHLAQKLESEQQGIITWMIQGASRALEQGHYTIPESSEVVSRKWKRDSDVVALWLEECTEKSQTAASRTQGQRLWTSFDSWRQSNRYSPMGSRTFYRRLQNLVGKPHRTKAGKLYSLIII